MKERPSTYGRVTRIFHWLTAFLILASLFFGFFMTHFAPEASEDQMYQNHVTFGWAILLLMVLRLGWRIFEPWPEEPAGLSPLRLKAFKWNHILLYAFVILMLSSGLGMLSLSGLGFSPGGVTADAIKDVPPKTFHGLLSKGVMLMFLMHMGGVFSYQFTKGDALARMGANLKKKK
ncbi:MAG: cytochrome b [Anaerolineae bacterium]|nr:cytochrome b [Anaerolineae bacterium]